MKFSLITVTMGDRPHLLAKLKASLAAQTYRDFEWIVVSHKDYPEFKGGLSRARNFGIEQATGDVLGFPDDDVATPSKNCKNNPVARQAPSPAPPRCHLPEPAEREFKRK